jgi:hypothetical protein
MADRWALLTLEPELTKVTDFSLTEPGSLSSPMRAYRAMERFAIFKIKKISFWHQVLEA